MTYDSFTNPLYLLKLIQQQLRKKKSETYFKYINELLPLQIYPTKNKELKPQYKRYESRFNINVDGNDNILQLLRNWKLRNNETMIYSQIITLIWPVFSVFS